jgi:predicted ABC-type transport system involved in lysophospholipase L1 biosynthesis ATPase subunit
MPDCILRASRLTKIVTSGDAPLTILDEVGFDIDSGDTVAVVGASGSGKTTLLGLLAGSTGRATATSGSTATRSPVSTRTRARRCANGCSVRLPVVPAVAALDRARERDAAARARRRADAAAKAKDWLARVGLARARRTIRSSSPAASSSASRSRARLPASRSC